MEETPEDNSSAPYTRLGHNCHENKVKNNVHITKAEFSTICLKSKQFFEVMELDLCVLQQLGALENKNLRSLVLLYCKRKKGKKEREPPKNQKDKECQLLCGAHY